MGMKRIAVVAIMLSTMLFGVLRVAAMGDYGHAMHGSMGAAADCMMSSCDAETATNRFDCVEHCLASAVTENGPAPLVVFYVLLVLAALVALARNRPVTGSFSAFRDQHIGTLLLHQQLSTVVLRN